MKRSTIIAAAAVTAGALVGAELYLRHRDRLRNRDRWFHEGYDGTQPYKVFHNRSGWELMPGYNVAGIRINQHGFRGDDFPRKKDTGAQRILCLGDSCTFGVAGDESPYPFQLQQLLGSMGLQNTYQVINAGVEGHASVNALLRLPWLLTFNPDILLVYLGWNDMWNSNPEHYPDLQHKTCSYWHYWGNAQGCVMVYDSFKEIIGLDHRTLSVSSYQWDDFVPLNFEYNLRQIVQMGRKEDVRVVLMTLPTLMPQDVSRASLGTLEKLQYPSFLPHGDIDNLKRLYQAFDTSIRKLAVEEDVDLIDVNAAFDPDDAERDRFFSDTWHPNFEGNLVIARSLAEGLRDREIVS